MFVRIGKLEAFISRRVFERAPDWEVCVSEYGLDFNVDWLGVEVTVSWERKQRHGVLEAAGTIGGG